MLPPAKISGTTLEKTVIAEGSIINASRIEHSVVGIRARIGYGTTVVSSYIMGNDFYESCFLQILLLSTADAPDIIKVAISID